MRVIALADLHGTLPDPHSLPPADVLVLAGDIAPDYHALTQARSVWASLQSQWLIDIYGPWEQSVRACTGVTSMAMTPGNHDWFHELPASYPFFTQFLIDEALTVGGKTLWFTPWIPAFPQWNYQLDDIQRRERFERIPYGLDLLVSHGPPYHILDRVWGGEHVGDRVLLQTIQVARPKAMVFGHIHEGIRDGLVQDYHGIQCYQATVQWTPRRTDHSWTQVEI